MTESLHSGIASTCRASTRPTGIVAPASDEAKRALRAILDQRLSHAEQNLDATEATRAEDDVWTTILYGMLHTARQNFRLARQFLQGATDDMHELLTDKSSETHAHLQRVAAFAHHQMGMLYRRQDRPKAAFDAHLIAHGFRHDAGSFEEVWQSALALGIDLDLAGDHQDAQAWFQKAISVAPQSHEEPAEKQALGWTHMAESLLQDKRWDEAVDAARSARLWWHTHDISAPSAARADMRLGHAILRCGTAQLEKASPSAVDSLREALCVLQEARESFEAFGSAFVADRGLYCDEQIDFAQRLIASLGSASA